MGKTSSYVIAILQQLPIKPKTASVVVLCHARELAYGINQEFKRMSKLLEITSGLFFGGIPIQDHMKILENETPHIIVATPGRLLILIEKECLKMDNVKHFVVDECDKIMECLGYLLYIENKKKYL